MPRYMMTVRLITTHRFEVEASDEITARNEAYDEVAPDLNPSEDQHVEVSSQEIYPWEGQP